MKRNIVCFAVVGSALFALAMLLPNPALAQSQFQPRQPGIQSPPQRPEAPSTRPQRPGAPASQPQGQQEEIAQGDKQRAQGFSPFVSAEGGEDASVPAAFGARQPSSRSQPQSRTTSPRSQSLQPGLRQIESGAFEVTQVTPSLRSHGVQVGWVWHGGYWHIPPTRRVVGCTWVWSPRGWRLVCREVWVQPPPQVCGWCGWRPCRCVRAPGPMPGPWW